jgi:hypothetical protein
MERSSLESALALLGEVLADRNQEAEVVAIGGGSLLLLGLIARPTKDLDIVASIENGEYVSSDPLPPHLSEAVHDVAQTIGLTEHWFNGGPTDLLRFGLPGGFAERVQKRRFGALTLHLAGRSDQIAFKLYAAIDQGPSSKHFADLQKLAPTEEELLSAAGWAVTHDPSEGFQSQLSQAFAALGLDHAKL